MGGAFIRLHEANARKRREAEAVAVAEDVPEVPAEEQPETVSPYEALTDDELFEAYVTNVGEDGTAQSREDMTAELSALDAE